MEELDSADPKAVELIGAVGVVGAVEVAGALAGAGVVVGAVVGVPVEAVEVSQVVLRAVDHQPDDYMCQTCCQPGKDSAAEPA